jgi:hypothetical protein
MGNSGANRLELAPAETGLSTKAGPGRPRSKSRESSAKSAALVDDVFVRHHVEDLIKCVESDRQRKKSIFGGAVNHPLLTLVITTIPLIISGMILLNDSRTRLLKEFTEQKRFYDQNISSLSKDLLSRTERAALLRYALNGGLGTCTEIGVREHYNECQRQLHDLIYERKKNYDASYLAWNTNYSDYLFNIAQIFTIAQMADRKQPESYSQLKDIISNLTTSTLKQMDACLSDLYKEYQRSSGTLPVAEGVNCARFDTDKNKVRSCGVVLAEKLHSIVTVVFNTLEKDEVKRVNRATVLAASLKFQAGHEPSNSSDQPIGGSNAFGQINDACQPQPIPDPIIKADAQP